MKSILSYTDLHKIGINALTGEACAYSMRVLCDLSDEGAALFRDFFGLPPDTPLAANWNSTVGDVPAVASCMLPHGVMPALVRFALMREGYQYVYASRADVSATGFNDDDIEKMPALKDRFDPNHSPNTDLQMWRNPKAHPSGQPSVGSRNVHAMTGRTL